MGGETFLHGGRLRGLSIVLVDDDAESRRMVTAVLGAAGAQVAKFESEIEAVRQREDRDRSLLAAGTVDAKQLTELQHELSTLERRQSSLEDSLLEVMERRN